MLNNKLLYTAITRASNYIQIIGDSNAFVHACITKEQIKRNTILQQIIINDFPI
jgi:ATP-dependent exoDNAse (exonuclease V) alpha subunit